MPKFTDLKNERDYSEQTMGGLQIPDESERIEKNKKIYSEYFDLELLKKVNSELMDLLDQCYFRSEFVGFDDFPQRNNSNVPLILAGNHSGMAFPWDAMVFAAQLFKRKNYGSEAARPLAAPMLSQTNLMNPFMIPNIWKHVGAVDATSLNFDTMMQQSDFNVMMYPEGVPGIGKGFNRRYQLQRLATSFVRMGLKYRTDIIPFYTVNGEYINPYSYQSDAVDRLSKKVGIPFIPVALHTLLILVQPWFFYYALPAKLTYVLGKRIRPYELLPKPYEEITVKELRELRDHIQAEMQAGLDRAVEQYGQQPYHWKEFRQEARKNLHRFPHFLPFGWPGMFKEFERLYFYKKQRDFQLDTSFWGSLKMLWNNPLAIAYYIPLLGWIPLLIKGYGKR